MNISKKISYLITGGFFRNSFFKYFYTKIFLRNRNILALIIITCLFNVSVWFLWLARIIKSGFAIESFFNFAFNIPFIPRYFSLLFTTTFFVLINFFLAFIIYKKNSFASYLLLFLNIFINLFIFALTIFYIIDLKL